MDTLCDLSDYSTRGSRPLRWTSTSGWPASNSYNVPNVERVYLIEGGVEVEHRVANGALPEIDGDKARDAASPNFVHSLDAAHLVRTVNAAAAEGITDILAVHDAYICLAPQAERFRQIIIEQMAQMYLDMPGLNGVIPAYDIGVQLLDPLEITKAKYPFD
jgi:Autographiviridae RNA polymerase